MEGGGDERFLVCWGSGDGEAKAVGSGSYAGRQGELLTPSPSRALGTGGQAGRFLGPAHTLETLRTGPHGGAPPI